MSAGYYKRKHNLSIMSLALNHINKSKFFPISEKSNRILLNKSLLNNKLFDLENENKDFNNTLGVSLNLDEDIIKYSLKTLDNKSETFLVHLPDCDNSLTVVLDQLVDLVFDPYFHDSSLRSQFIDIIDNDPRNFQFNEFENKIDDLSQIIIRLDAISYLLVSLCDNFNINNYSRNISFIRCIDKLMEIISRYISTNIDSSLFQLFTQTRDDIAGVNFKKVKGPCLSIVNPLMKVIQIPKILLQNFEFDIVDADNLDSRLIKLKINFLLIYHALIYETRKMFEVCVEIGFNNKTTIINLLEGFMLHSAELENIEILMGLDKVVQKWVSKESESLRLYIYLWTLNVEEKIINWESHSSGTNNMLHEKFDVVRLFLQELKDLFITSFDNIPENGLSRNLVEPRLHKKRMSLQKFIEQNIFHRSTKFLNQVHHVKYKIETWSNNWISKGNRGKINNKSTDIIKIYDEKHTMSSKIKLDSDVVVKNSHSDHIRWYDIFEKTTYRDIQNVKKYDEFKKKRDRIMFLFFGDE